ncbi:uncharacterized protein LOC110449823 [Mizuhopecten yessoensis]|uniref:Uncharacterized protein n=1 Tax=Mizuhopecten yessoensis TaxID=6573 RepID=A0A210QQG3_MIZYE|nr:uncharacterized protein LOC110449823 [Mizuhopecten yessoensis]OWF50944.1 hypothetical protein KP79_PYT07469 [Mizuhopecten yessoensis]
MKEGDVDRYIRESSKSYNGCRVKNSARRNSLQKKTIGIETERKMAAANLGREEKQLREQLRHMQIDKMKNTIVHNMREKAKKGNNADIGEEEEELRHLPTEPWPVTLSESPRGSPSLGNRSNSSLAQAGMAHAKRRGRRMSHEFEDLDMNTKTGKLQTAPNMAKSLMARRNLHRPTSGSLTSVRGRMDSPRQGRGNLDSSDTSSSSAVSSLEDLHWIGNPVATKSVRRARKTVEEQELTSELHKLSISDSKKRKSKKKS